MNARPRTRVSQKSGLNKAILYQCWDMMASLLDYKLAGYVLWVAAAYTTQMCLACRFTDKKNRNGRMFLCLSCRHLAHTGRNTVRNIVDAGMHIWAGAAGSLYAPSIILYLIFRPRPPEAPMLGDIWTRGVFLRWLSDEPSDTDWNVAVRASRSGMTCNPMAREPPFLREEPDDITPTHQSSIDVV